MLILTLNLNLRLPKSNSLCFIVFFFPSCRVLLQTHFSEYVSHPGQWRFTRCKYANSDVILDGVVANKVESCQAFTLSFSCLLLGVARQTVHAETQHTLHILYTVWFFCKLEKSSACHQEYSEVLRYKFRSNIWRKLVFCFFSIFSIAGNSSNHTCIVSLSMYSSLWDLK